MRDALHTATPALKRRRDAEKEGEGVPVETHRGVVVVISDVVAATGND
jgi:hypothetical protein